MLRMAAKRGSGLRLVRSIGKRDAPQTQVHDLVSSDREQIRWCHFKDEAETNPDGRKYDKN